MWRYGYVGDDDPDAIEARNCIRLRVNKSWFRIIRSFTTVHTAKSIPRAPSLDSFNQRRSLHWRYLAPVMDQSRKVTLRADGVAGDVIQLLLILFADGGNR
jgi:hypothetical protein